MEISYTPGKVAGAIVAITRVILFSSFYFAFLIGALAFESYQQLQDRTGRPW